MAILVLCTASRCRSPMAAGLLRSRLGDGSPVSSAGFLPSGAPVVGEAARVMAEVGLDISGHVSRRVAAADLLAADLVLTMTVQHAVDATLLAPGAWGRIFPLRDAAARAERVGRCADRPVSDWVADLGLGRQRAELLSLPRSVDIDDPIGRPLRDLRATREVLSGLLTTMASAIGPAS